MCVVPPSRNQRRATVLVMVVGVLAMLFIIGSTLLVVARFERQTAEQKVSAENMKAVTSAVVDPVITQLREDIVGSDDVPYNRGWYTQGQPGTGDHSVLEDAADLSGKIPQGSTSPDAKQKARSGDLLISSPEPYALSTTDFRYHAMSWMQDAVTDGLTPPNNNLPFLTLLPGKPWIDLNGDQVPDLGDADGDGVPDAPYLGPLGISATFGGSYDMFMRIIPHGGMVQISPWTHPALLAQVIRPADRSGSITTLLSKIAGLDFASNTNAVPENESRIRRRFFLPDDMLQIERNALPSTDIRKAFPLTLGYEPPDPPHWWPTENTADLDWWKLRMLPPAPLTDSYSPGQDRYDRRHLITTISSDDLLRPQRDEARLRVLLGPDKKYGTADDINNTAQAQFYYVLNPETTPSTINVGTVAVQTQPQEAYGRDASTGQLKFNGPGLRTQFSLRDVLVNPAMNGGYQASYTRAVQLAAYYLAMIQHTSVPGSTSPAPTTDGLLEQLRTALQLAINTIDFADSGDNNGDGVINASDTLGDPISYLELDPDGAGGPILPIKVAGVEKQPFITELYAKVAAAYNGITWTDSGSIWAVEIYNPYETAINLNGYRLKTASGDYDLGTAWAAVNAGSPFLGAHSYAIFANTVGDTNDPLNKPFSDPAFRIAILSGLRFSPDPFTNSPDIVTPVELIASPARVLRLMLSGASPAPALVIDRIDPASALEASPNAVQHFAQRPTDADLALIPPGGHPVSGVPYWRHTSIQRHKEPNPARPLYWHFTLAHQKAFQSDIQYTGYPGAGRIHDLYGAGRAVPSALRYVTEADPDWFGVTGNAPAVAGFPILVSDAGVEPPNTAFPNMPRACRAFPTTGSLLLVTRYGHGDRLVPSGSTLIIEQTPVTVAAARPIYTEPPDPTKALRNTAAQLQQVDNGHMPLVDRLQNCKDNEEEMGRLDVPWGHLVYSYFTALPIEELADPDLTVTTNNYATSYDAYFAYRRGGTTGDVVSRYPYVEQVAQTTGSPTIGPKVNGRININYAPWWVLDGLPVLPDALQTDSTDALPPPQSAGKHVALAGLPVPQLLSQLLDPLKEPSDAANDLANTDRPGYVLMRKMMDESAVSTQLYGLPTISPTLAQRMAEQREQRGADATTAWRLNSNNPNLPGFLTVAGVADVFTNIMLETQYSPAGSVAPGLRTFTQLRMFEYPATVGGTAAQVKPFAYLGYLQLVAPLVRIQDWATVKNHVFTIYSTLGDNGNPPVWLRTQVTVDRTRCLYTRDLPAKVAETDPIGYYNAVNDQ